MSTLAQRLAREAAPCSADHNGYGFIGMDCECHLRPAIQAAIEEAIRACRDVALDELSAPIYEEMGTREAVDARLRYLLTDDVEDGG